jgi:Protein of unknown function DUF262
MEYSSSELPLSWFRDRYLDGTLRLKPPFQRKPVWAARQKCYLVESVLLHLPVPEIFIQQTTTPEGKTTFAIVDGQQRIRAVLQFIGSELEPDEAEHNKFALDKLSTTSDWYGIAFEDMDDVARKRFYMYRFAIRYLNTESDDEIRDMFRRLNKYLVPLSAQELRNSTYLGPFVVLANDLADEPYWAVGGIMTPATIRRMGDVEFMSELLIGVMHGPQSGSARTVDSYYETYEDYEDEFPGQKDTMKSFAACLDAVQTLFPDIKATRWSNKGDFYSLFVALAAVLRDSPGKRLPTTRWRKALNSFADEINRRRADEKAKVAKGVQSYVRAIERGANDKPRRAARHQALVDILRS